MSHDSLPAEAPQREDVHALARRSRPLAGIVIGVLVAAGLVAVGLGPRLAHRTALAKAQAGMDAPKRVRVAPVTTGALRIELRLPATSAPIRTTQLYAKSTGFLRKNHVEVGDLVKSGQVLADVDSRETDQELLLAEARVVEAESNLGIVLGTASRNADLAQQGVVSKQQAEDARLLANGAVASLKTRRVDVERLRALRSYQSVTAPFDGTVLRRNVDPGTLVGPSGAAGIPLFEIAAIDVMRVVVDVPQTYASFVVKDLTAKVFMPQTPEKASTGKIVRLSAALDPTTRTRRTEIEIAGGNVLPNAFVYVTLDVPRSTAPLVIAASALVVRKEGTLVAKVEGDHVKLVPIEVGRDLGKEIEVSGGLATGDRLVTNPPDELVDGSKIEVVTGAPDGR
jgi:RND family efflux transporter MFP subunit